MVLMRRTLVVAAACAACVGCNAILGLDNFKVTDGGVEGVQCGSQLTPNKDVVTSCVLRTSCLPAVFRTTSISMCISLNVQQAFLGSACTTRAASCSDIELCDGYGLTGAALCPPGQTGWSCEGNIAVDCTDGYFMSCDKFGGQCTMSGSKAGCRVVSSCSDANNTTHCQGDTLYKCVNGQGFGAVCTNFGAKCEILGGQPNCYYAAPSCGGTVTPCDGQVAQACVNGQLLRSDCASVGLTCDAEKTGTYCVAPGCKLSDVTACQESCNGSVMHLCYGGAPYTVDCTDYGFSTCQELDDTSKGGIGKYVTCSN